MEGAIQRLRFARGFPFPIDGGKSAGVEHLTRLAIPNFEQVFPQVRIIDRLPQVAGPPQRLHHNTIQTEHFLGRIAGVVIVDSHRARAVLGECKSGKNHPDEHECLVTHDPAL